jgi:hypothetical protein
MGWCLTTPFRSLGAWRQLVERRDWETGQEFARCDTPGKEVIGLLNPARCDHESETIRSLMGLFRSCNVAIKMLSRSLSPHPTLWCVHIITICRNTPLRFTTSVYRNLTRKPVNSMKFDFKSFAKCCQYHFNFG